MKNITVPKIDWECHDFQNKETFDVKPTFNLQMSDFTTDKCRSFQNKETFDVKLTFNLQMSDFTTDKCRSFQNKETFDVKPTLTYRCRILLRTNVAVFKTRKRLT